MQGRTMQLLGLCAFQLLLYAGMCAGDRGTSEAQSLVGLTPDVYVIGIWQPYLKTVNKCENFRHNNTPALFQVWPEHVCNFCCEDKLTPHTIASYVHLEKNGRYLHPIRYYDVGIVDAFTPFWHSWRPDRISQKDITKLVYCEVNDLKRFYGLRFWQSAFAKQGLLYSGFPFVLLVEFLVFLAAIPKFVRWGSEFPIWDTLRRFWGWDTTWDLIHLCLLGVNGSLLMEAVGHWDPCGWEAVLLYNSAVFYTYLSLWSIISAVMLQIALWTALTTDDRLKPSEENGVIQTPEGDEGQRYRIKQEWQLQRISAQCAVFYTVSLYCNFVTVHERDEFVAWLLGIIIIAQVWSFVVAFAVLNIAFKVGHSWYKEVAGRKGERQVPVDEPVEERQTQVAETDEERQTQVAETDEERQTQVAASETTQHELQLAELEGAAPDAGRTGLP